jgi:hypothetical protein
MARTQIGNYYDAVCHRAILRSHLTFTSDNRLSVQYPISGVLRNEARIAVPEDGRRSPEAGLQEQASNCPVPLLSRDVVVIKSYAGGISLSEEKPEEIYGRMCCEYVETRKAYLACFSELKRIGEDFKVLGKELIERPSVLNLNKAAFAADTAAVPSLLAQYADLKDKLRDQQKEIEVYGPLPTPVYSLPIL